MTDVSIKRGDIGAVASVVPGALDHSQWVQQSDGSEHGALREILSRPHVVPGAYQQHRGRCRGAAGSEDVTLWVAVKWRCHGSRHCRPVTADTWRRRGGCLEACASLLLVHRRTATRLRPLLRPGPGPADYREGDAMAAPVTRGRLAVRPA
jgi:hypothetical protein